MPYRRSEERTYLRVPLTATITAREDDDVVRTWDAQVLNASRRGLKLRVNRFFARRTPVVVTLPFSFAFRDYPFTNSICRAQGIVVYSIRYSSTDFEIGIEVEHEQAPAELKARHAG
jgi:PilZ domain-containing protein